MRMTRRHLPHWSREGSVYFVTFRTAMGTLTPAERSLIFGHLRSGDGRFYTLIATCVMPDHVHILIRPNDGMEMSRVLKGIKGVTARLINQARGTRGHVWQDESWDRIVRDEREFTEKLNYMLNNPVAKGLVQNPWEYDGWFLGNSPTGNRTNEGDSQEDRHSCLSILRFEEP
jgi:putative transposase